MYVEEVGGSLMPLVIRERNERWHVYETSTEPWALVTAFDSREAAELYCAQGRIQAGHFDVHLGSWVPEVLQEDFKCVVCGRALWAGSKAYVRVILVNAPQTEKRFEGRCLDHIRTRFERDDPVR